MVRSRRLVMATVLVAIVVLGSALPALAQEPALVFPAGTACSDFDLGIDFGSPGVTHVDRTLVGPDGTVRLFSVGQGSELIFTNMSTDAAFTTRSNGAVSHTTNNADGSQTVTLMGHWIVILSPTDNPPGPSTTLYVGRVEYTIHPTGNWTVLKTSGNNTDICVALSN